MKTRRHTSGPWGLHKVEDEDPRDEHWAVYGPKAHLIAEVHHDWVDWKEANANAEMIVVAPQMWLACKALLDAYHHGADGDASIKWEHLDQAWEHAKLALEGR